MVVVAIIALASAVVSMSLPDPANTRLEREGVRLVAILETARVQARALGAPVRWMPGPATPTPANADNPITTDFHFTGLPAGHELPERWADAELSGRISVVLPNPNQGQPGGLLLGPDPIIPAQRLTLVLDDKRLTLATDGLSPFAVSNEEPATAP